MTGFSVSKGEAYQMEIRSYTATARGAAFCYPIPGTGPIVPPSMNFASVPNFRLSSLPSSIFLTQRTTRLTTGR